MTLGKKIIIPSQTFDTVYVYQILGSGKPNW
jgi:hypothetical protein